MNDSATHNHALVGSSEQEPPCPWWCDDRDRGHDIDPVEAVRGERTRLHTHVIDDFLTCDLSESVQVTVTQEEDVRTGTLGPLRVGPDGMVPEDAARYGRALVKAAEQVVAKIDEIDWMIGAYRRLDKRRRAEIDTLLARLVEEQQAGD